jgi:steroid delta-isomerase-like uncharacterized protein
MIWTAVRVAVATEVGNALRRWLAAGKSAGAHANCINLEVLMMKRILGAATCLAMVVLACSWQAKTQPPQSGRSVLEAYVSAWNRHDFAAFDTLLAADAIHEDIAAGFHGQGPAQIKEFMRGMIKEQSDLNWRLTTIVEAGQVVAAEWTWTSTYTGDTPSGPVVAKRVAARGASVAVIENGRIKRFTDYYDIASAFREVPVGSAASN